MVLFDILYLIFLLMIECLLRFIFEVVICIIVFICCYIEMNKDSLYCEGVL